MKKNTKYAVAVVFSVVLLLAGCNGGEDVESNLGVVTEVSSGEEIIEEVKIARGSVELVAENAQEEVREAEVAPEASIEEESKPEAYPNKTSVSTEPEEMENTEVQEDNAAAVEEPDLKSSEKESKESPAKYRAEDIKAAKEIAVPDTEQGDEEAVIAQDIDKIEEKSPETKPDDQQNLTKESKEDEAVAVKPVEEKSVKEEETVENTTSLQGSLSKFYGRWETNEGSSEEKIILEIGSVEAEDIHNSVEGMEYIRFGYEASEFFPREKIIQVENQPSQNAYLITVSIMEEIYSADGWSIVDTGKVEQYRIALSDQNKMILTYAENEGETEFFFYKN